MTPAFVRVFVFLLGLAYFLLCYALPTIRFRLASGHSAVVIESAETPHGIVARFLLGTATLSLLSILVFCFLPDRYAWLVPLDRLRDPLVNAVGVVASLLGLPFCVLAQWQMGRSWRIGIDSKAKTALVQSGIYRFSRNPIYVSLLFAALGFFCLTPNFLTALSGVLTFVLFSIQVRLEEEFQRKLHGKAFDDYCAKVRRWI